MGTAMKLRLKWNKNSIVFRTIFMFTIPFIILMAIVMVQNQHSQERIQDEFILTNQHAFSQFTDEFEGKVKVAQDLKEVVTKNINLLEFIAGPNMSSESEFLGYYLDNVVPIVKYATAFTNTNDYEIKVFLNNEDIPESWPYFLHMKHQHNHSQIQTFIADSTQTMMWLHADEKPNLPKSQASDRPQYTLVSKLYSSTRELLGLITIMVAEDTMLPPISMQQQDREMMTLSSMKENEALQETVANISSSITEQEGYLMQGDYIYFYKQYTDIGETLIYKVALFELNDSMNKSTRSILFMMVSCLVIFMIVCIFMFRLIFLRLNRMIAIMKKVIQGDLKMRVPDTRTDELGQLAQDMNGLIEMNNELIHNMIMKERLRKEAQIQALQYQINPHFIYNTLDIFRMRLIKEKMFQVSDLLADFGKMLRYNLSDQTHETTLGDEIDLIQKYMNIKRMDSSSTIEMELSIDDRLRKYPVIKFLLQPVVENCLKHGKSKEKEMLTIQISSEIKHNEIYITIMDDGNGIRADKLNQLNEMFQKPLMQYREEKRNKGSIGLQNINSRLRLYYGEQYFLEIDSVEQAYTCVTIKIPYQWEVESTGTHINRG